MKKASLISFMLCFVLIVGVDADATSIWVVMLLLILFVVSAILLKRTMPELWEDKK